MILKKTLATAVIAGLLTVLVALAGARAAADKTVDAEKMALAEKYVKAVSMERLLKDMVPGMSRQMAASYMRQKPGANPATVKLLARDIAERFSAKFRDLIPRVTKVTAELMTIEELRAVIAFYESAPGRSLLAKFGKLNEATMRLVIPWVQQEMPGIVIDSIKALEAKGYKLK